MSVATAAGAAAAAAEEASDLGTAERVEARLGETTLDVFTYRPDGCAPSGLLIVFHGNERDAAEYRDRARPLARRACLVVHAPLFDAERFPNWSYQRGGVAEDGVLRPRRAWTTELVPRLVAWARARDADIAGPTYLFGHSAGGQFLSRVAAFSPPPGIGRIVVANPATYVLASLEERAPYGFGGLFAAKNRRERLRTYLAAPITVYLGEEDTGARSLTRGEGPDRQGENRLDRGLKTFAQARATAADNGWPFGWRLVVAPGVDHSAEEMLAPERAWAALGLD